MKIQKKEIKRLVELSALSYDEDKLEALADAFSGIAGFVDEITSVDIPDMTDDMDNIKSIEELREDNPQKPLPREEVLYNAPVHNNEAFIVPKVVD